MGVCVCVFIKLHITAQSGPVILAILWHCVCVFFPFVLGVRVVDEPAGVAQEEGHTGFIIHLPYAVLALIFLARKDSAVPFSRRP